MVADENSLLEGAARLQPAVVVLDVSFAAGNMTELLARLRERARGAKVLLLSAYDEPTLAAAALIAGASGVVLKQKLATDLMPAVDALIAGELFLPQGKRPLAR